MLCMRATEFVTTAKTSISDRATFRAAFFLITSLIYIIAMIVGFVRPLVPNCFVADTLSIHGGIDALHHPPGLDTGLFNAQPRRVGRETFGQTVFFFAVGEGVLHAVRVKTASRLAIFDGCDFLLLVQREIVPVCPGPDRDLGKDAFSKDVRV